MDDAVSERRGEPRFPADVLAPVVVGDQTVTIPATVLRCSVCAVDPEAVTYRAGLRVEEVCPPIWEELTASRAERRLSGPRHSV